MANQPRCNPFLQNGSPWQIGRPTHPNPSQESATIKLLIRCTWKALSACIIDNIWPISRARPDVFPFIIWFSAKGVTCQTRFWMASRPLTTRIGKINIRGSLAASFAKTSFRIKKKEQVFNGVEWSLHLSSSEYPVSSRMQPPTDSCRHFESLLSFLSPHVIRLFPHSAAHRGRSSLWWLCPRCLVHFSAVLKEECQTTCDKMSLTEEETKRWTISKESGSQSRFRSIRCGWLWCFALPVWTFCKSYQAHRFLLAFCRTKRNPSKALLSSLWFALSPSRGNQIARLSSV